MIACPECGHPHTLNQETRPTREGFVRRRRECHRCSERFTTYEVVAPKGRKALARFRNYLTRLSLDIE